MARKTNRKPCALSAGASALTMDMLRASLAVLRKQGNHPKQLKPCATA